MAKKAFVKLTDPAGKPEYIATAWVQRVMFPRNRTYAPLAKAALELSGSVVVVQETPEEVVALLEREGGE